MSFFGYGDPVAKEHARRLGEQALADNWRREHYSGVERCSQPIRPKPTPISQEEMGRLSAKAFGPLPREWQGRPTCILWVEDNIARCCAWHPNKAEGDAWAEKRGYQITHTICSTCEEKLRATIS